MNRSDTERPHVVGGKLGGAAEFGIPGLLLALVVVGVLFLGVVYLVGQWQASRVGAVFRGGLLVHALDVGKAWEPALETRGLWRTAAIAAVTVVGAGLTGSVWARTRRDRRREVRWARPIDLQRGGLTMKRPHPGRLVVGGIGRQLVATPTTHSLIVFGPSGSGKTAGFAVPALLEWQGPAVVSSVKTDLLMITRDSRGGGGQTLVFDPLNRLNDPDRCGWDPIEQCGTYEAAQTLAGALMSLSDFGRVEKGDFWQSSAQSLLGPLLLAANRGHCSIREVRRWLNLTDWKTPGAFLAKDPEAAESLIGATEKTPNDTALSYVATARVALRAYETPAAVESTRLIPQVDLDALLDGHQTLYLVADEDDQKILRPLFVGLVDAIMRHAARRVNSGQRAERPLLVLLDEAANSTPLPDLDRYASVARDRGVQLVTIWQDLGQIEERYSRDRARTILNNHQAKAILPGVTDRELLEYMSKLLGEERIRQRQTGGGRGSKVAESETWQPLATVDELRRLAQHEAIFVHGTTRPARVQLRPYYQDRRWRDLGQQWHPADYAPSGKR